jgi:Tfp pilus assembly protein FimT
MNHVSCIMKNNNGVTLIELIVAASVVIIIVVALGFSFEGWMGSYKAESQMKEMYTDLMNARARSMERNRSHFVSLTTTQYTIQEDISPWPDGDGSLTAADNTRPTGYNDPIPLLQKNLNPKYPITWSDIGDTQIDFTTRGLSNDTKTICINSDIDTDNNCIVISETRMNLGKLTTKIPAPYGGTCDSTNCVAK